VAATEAVVKASRYAAAYFVLLASGGEARRRGGGRVRSPPDVDETKPIDIGNINVLPILDATSQLKLVPSNC
jgi:hypothetical protein